MCKFFSCISNGKGKIRYFNAGLRTKIRAGEILLTEDSHSSIAEFFKGEITRDRWNGYEYGPITKNFVVDQQNARDSQGFILDDREQVKLFCAALDFNEVVPNWEYISGLLARLEDYKPVNPITAKKMPSKKKIFETMASVGDSVGSSVRDSVGDSVWSSVMYLLRSLPLSREMPLVPGRDQEIDGNHPDICHYRGAIWDERIYRDIVGVKC